MSHNNSLDSELALDALACWCNRYSVLHLSYLGGTKMSAKSRLKRALNAIDDAQRVLKRIQANAEVDDEIRTAKRELDDAESYIRRAIREIDS